MNIAQFKERMQQLFNADSLAALNTNLTHLLQQTANIEKLDPITYTLKQSLETLAELKAHYPPPHYQVTEATDSHDQPTTSSLPSRLGRP